jgi:hypothetical protein
MTETVLSEDSEESVTDAILSLFGFYISVSGFELWSKSTGFFLKLSKLILIHICKVYELHTQKFFPVKLVFIFISQI